MYAPRVSVRSPSAAPSHSLQLVPQLRNASSANLAGARVRPDAFQYEGDLPMSARPQLQPDFDGPEDRRLADDIARVMHHRPLMSRLARVETSHGDAANFVAKSATRVAPTPAPAAAETVPPPTSTDPRSIEEVIDDLGYAASAPPCAEWLHKARREHRKERMRNAIAWLTTIAIASTIVAAAYLLLRA
jgi:hypothetical protein